MEYGALEVERRDGGHEDWYPQLCLYKHKAKNEGYRT